MQGHQEFTGQTKEHQGQGHYVVYVRGGEGLHGKGQVLNGDWMRVSRRPEIAMTEESASNMAQDPVARRP